MFCKYEVNWQKISQMFGLHAYHPIERPTENNVWGTRFGRGSFIKCYKKILRAKAYCENTYERVLGKRGKVVVGESVVGNLADQFSDLQGNKNVFLGCGDSRNLYFVPSKSIDAVITDPPYFDNVMYSELADFFYVWLRLALKDKYPWFSPELSNREAEIVQNDKSGKTSEVFACGLTDVFTECNRVLKDDGILLFTFHHNKLWAWELIAKVLRDSGFYISAAPVVRSEGKTGYHGSSGNIRYDVCLVGRKLPPSSEAREWDDIQRNVKEQAIRWAIRILKAGMTISRADSLVIVMAAFLQHFSRNWNNVFNNGELMSLKQGIDEASKLVEDLQRVIAGFGDKITDKKQPIASQRQLAL